MRMIAKWTAAAGVAMTLSGATLTGGGCAGRARASAGPTWAP